MAQRKSTRARAPARSRKALADASGTTDATHQALADTAMFLFHRHPAQLEFRQGNVRFLQTLQRFRLSMPVSSAPDHTLISSFYSNRVPTPPIARRLSFGTAVSGDEESPSFPVENDDDDDTATPPIAVLEEVSQSRTPMPKRKRASPTPTPSPPIVSTKKGAKKPLLDSFDLKAARQANPAKRIRPIARFDSDDEGNHTHTPLTDDEKAMIQSCLSEAIGTPVAHVSEGLSYSYFADNEDNDEDRVACDWSQSPSPRRPSASSSRRTNSKQQEKVSMPPPDTPTSSTRRANGKERAKASPPPPSSTRRSNCRQKATESSPAVPARPSTKREAVDTPRPLPPALPVDKLSKPNKRADVFGSGNCSSPIRVDDSGDDELNVAEFPEIPHLLHQITDHLNVSGILSRLRLGEIRPNYAAIDATPPTLPSVLDVLGSMSQESETLAVYDALLFRGAGVYVNPFFADPQSMSVDKNRVVFASGPNSQKPVVFVMPVVVETCCLLSATQIINGSPDKHLRLTGYVFEELFALFSSIVCTLFGRDAVYAYMNQLCLQFSSRSDKVSPASSANSPQKFARNCGAFKPAGSSRNRPTTPRFGATSLASGVDIRFPHSRAHTDTIPVFDGRHSEGDFRFTVYHWRNIMQLPRFGVPPVDEGNVPDNSQAQDLPELNSNSFTVAMVAFTMGTFGPEGSSMPPVSFNLHFAVLLGTYNYTEFPRVLTVNELNAIRRSL
ncbi:hypothetical protein EYR40_008319 [Pleurotus pulmonarius]|nr:hypothetical protein EYR40_008319 [Pleurotus pulmonarius]